MLFNLNKGLKMLKLISSFLLMLMCSIIYETSAQSQDTAKTFTPGPINFSVILKNDSLAYEQKVPTITLTGGFVKLFYHSDVFDGKLADINSYEINISSTNLIGTPEDTNIVILRSNGLFLKSVLSTWKSTSDASQGLRSDTWTFGTNDCKGYGYKLGKYSYLIFHNTGGLNWNKITFLDTAESTKNKDAIEIFGNAIRFGEYSEAGIKFRFVKNLSLNAGYERSMIYPRHLFWKWTWSKIIEGTGHVLLDLLINEIHQSIPVATPIIYFILKNAYSYGFYELYSSRMNWPSETIPPIMFNSFKVGLSMYF